MATSVKYATKEILDMINRVARDIKQYNRSVPQECIDELPTDTRFPIAFALEHYHRAGEPVEPHMRCLFTTCHESRGLENILIDVEMSLYKFLPTVDLPVTI